MQGAHEASIAKVNAFARQQAEQRIASLVRVEIVLPPRTLLQRWRNFLCDYTSATAMVKAGV